MSAIKETALDPVTGFIDMDLLMTGISSYQRVKKEELASQIEKILLETPQRILKLEKLKKRLELLNDQAKVENIESSIFLLRKLGKVLQENDDVILIKESINQ